MKETITILAIDDEPLILEGLRGVLHKTFPENKFYVARNFKIAQMLLQEHSIDLVLLDLDLNVSEQNGLDIAPYLREHYPKAKIIVITVNVKIDYVEQLFDNGLVDGYLDKNFQLDILSQAIEQVMQGKTYLSEELQATIERGRFYTLSNREREVIELLTKGLTKKQIGYHLNLSPHSIDSHVRKLFEKLKVNTTQELVGKYVQYCTATTENPNRKL